MTIMPHDPQVEQVLLSACLCNQVALDICIGMLKDYHFYESPHPALWAQITKSYAAGEPIAADNIRSKFSKEPVKKYINALADNYFPNDDEHITGLCKRLQELWQGREVLWLLTRNTQALDQDVMPDIAKLVEQLEGDIFRIGQMQESKRGPSNDGYDMALKDIEKAMKNGGVVGIGSGYSAIDKITGGFARQDLVIIAGRPGMGKTSLALGIADNACKEGSVLFFSLEMSKAQLEMKRASMLTGIGVAEMRRGNISEDEYKRLIATRPSPNLYIDDEGKLTVEQILVRARRLARRTDLKLVIIDYIGLMEASQAARGQGLNASIQDISKALKAMAKELDIPVIALSQLNRAVEGQPNKRPQLSHLRDSGAIEQDADMVLFCYRDEYYLERDMPVQTGGETDEKFRQRMASHMMLLDESRGKAEVIVAKNRAGSVGTAHMQFEGRLTKFADNAAD